MSQHLEQAKVHIDRGELDSAMNELGLHLNGDFNDASALFMLGGTFLQKGFHGVGAALTREALRLRPKFPEAALNMGVAYKQENRNAIAAEFWQLALEMEDVPAERAKILNNIGSLYVNEGCPEKSIEYFSGAHEIDPQQPDAIFNRALAYLELGRWEDGWQGYEKGWQTGARPGRSYAGIPVWDGTPGQTVIVWGEQGLGDEIMFASTLPDMIAASKHIILDCHPRLVETFKRSFPGVTVHGTRKQMSALEWLPGCGAEAHICISSLPKFFRNADADFPGTPFLQPGGAVRPPLPPYRHHDRPRIGLAWAGGVKKTRSDLRSIPLEQLVPVLRAVDADFYSLQYTPHAAREVCELEEATGIRIRHYPGWVECKDYDRTISFVASMDLTITVSTAIHHASNAVGTPTWTLVPSKPAWRYGVKGHLWYHQTNKFFRQGPDETWGPAIQRVADALKEHFA